MGIASVATAPQHMPLMALVHSAFCTVRAVYASRSICSAPLCFISHNVYTDVDLQTRDHSKIHSIVLIDTIVLSVVLVSKAVEQIRL